MGPVVMKDAIVTLTTPFGDGTLVLESCSGQEALSEPFVYSISAYSEDNALAFDTIIGKDITVGVGLPDGSATRNINGVVTRFSMGQSTAEATHYHMEVRPWLWLLGLQADCAVFQNMSVPDIVKQVCSDAGFTDVEDKLSGSYSAREYVVQYNETALAFVSRLMEEAGMFYFFTHTANAHTLVLADSGDALEECPQAATLEFQPKNTSVVPASQVADVSLEQCSVTGTFAVGDYNFTTPETDLTASAPGGNARTVYEYPTGHTVKDDGESLAGMRLDALEAEQCVLSASSPASGLHPGGTMTIEGHDRNDINAKWLVTSVALTASKMRYSSTFTAIPATATYRPRRRHPRPSVPGPLTALVVGKDGEEIWTDEYGRVKVQFYWDRVGEKNEKSSCWVRVAQPWAGKGYGAVFLPRIGHEVVVSFIDGDPDRPLVTGCVYNATQTLPYDLPANATRTLIKTNSSKDAEGSNELRFEDKAGEEEVYIHAQKDMNTVVENARTTTIKTADDTVSLEQGNRTFTVEQGTETHSVKGTRDITVEGDETRSNSANYDATTEGDHSLSVQGALSTSCDGAETHTANDTRDITVGGAETRTNNADYSITTSGNYTLTVQGNLTIDVTGTFSIKSSSSGTIDGGGQLQVKGGMVQIN
ncbi:type VI secretion system tip protein VgrG [Desulfobaculum senezii]